MPEKGWTLRWFRVYDRESGLYLGKLQSWTGGWHCAAQNYTYDTNGVWRTRRQAAEALWSSWRKTQPKASVVPLRRVVGGEGTHDDG